MKYFLLFLFFFSTNLYSQDDFEELMEDDLESLEEELDLEDIEANVDELEEDLESDLAGEIDDLEEGLVGKRKPKKRRAKKKIAKKKRKVVKEVKVAEELEDFEEEKIDDIKISKAASFDTGIEEQQLLSLASKISYKIEQNIWDQIKRDSNVTTTYEVIEGDWLFKISKNLFGTGHYYPKIWALNPYITNPHEIEPGMILIFDSSSEGPPSLSMQGEKGGGGFTSDWLAEKRKLVAQGVHVEYASDSMAQIIAKSTAPENEEYKKYTPTAREHRKVELSKEYGTSGFSKASVVVKNFKQGYSVNTFMTPNTIEDFGVITDGIKDSIFIGNKDRAYIRASNDQEDDISIGDVFSIYSKSKEKVSHENSDRSGYKYMILGHVRITREVGQDKWEVEVFGTTNSIQRGDRLTVYTPKIEKINKRYNSQVIESVIIDSYSPLRTILMSGDITYLDRGREDGVRIGDIFGVFSNRDKRTRNFIDKDPVYLLAKIVVISLTEDFATGLILNGAHAVPLGGYAQTISEAQAQGASQDNSLEDYEDTQRVEVKEDLGEQVLEDAENMKLTEDELEELDRMENKKSFIDETEKDLEDAEQLEEETDDAEDLLDSEDKKLIEKDLEGLEGEIGAEEDELEAIEKEFGKKYIDEELNEKENPYGLSENDLEEVDELLEVNEE